MGKLRLALIAGGKSSEREVSLKSGNQVYQALNQEKYDIRRYDPLTDLERLVREAGELDAALIIMHGRGGEDGSMQGLLDLLEVPYQGSGVLASALAMNKELSKTIYRQAGLKVPRALIFDRAGAPSPQEIEADLGLPVVIKPVNEGSSIGISKAQTLASLETRPGRRLRPGQPGAGGGIHPGHRSHRRGAGQRQASGPAPGGDHPADKYDFFDYEAKYQPGASHEICPARLNPEVTKRAQECALIAHQALGCRGYSRTDMMIRDQDIFVLETNTIPGMTATSLFPQGAKAAGIEFPDLLDTLINLALEKV